MEVLNKGTLSMEIFLYFRRRLLPWYVHRDKEQLHSHTARKWDGTQQLPRTSTLLRWMLKSRIVRFYPHFAKDSIESFRIQQWDDEDRQLQLQHMQLEEEAPSPTALLSASWRQWLQETTETEARFKVGVTGGFDLELTLNHTEKMTLLAERLGLSDAHRLADRQRGDGG